jgi:hypothetical protein
MTNFVERNHLPRADGAERWTPDLRLGIKTQHHKLSMNHANTRTRNWLIEWVLSMMFDNIRLLLDLQHKRRSFNSQCTALYPTLAFDSLSNHLALHCDLFGLTFSLGLRALSLQLCVCLAD